VGEEVGFFSILGLGLGAFFKVKKRHMGKSCRSKGNISKLLQCSIMNNIIKLID
jgi:hypothetical protein